MALVLNYYHCLFILFNRFGFSDSLIAYCSNDKAATQISSNPTLSIAKKDPFSMANLAALTCMPSYFSVLTMWTNCFSH